MIETSWIEAEQKMSPLGKIEQVNYQWKGESPYTRISRDLLWKVVGNDDGAETVQIGPYKLLRVENLPWDFSVLFVRADRFGALRVALYKSTRLIDLAYRRLIITLAVWKLAEFHPARIPSWRDIKIVKRLLKK